MSTKQRFVRNSVVSRERERGSSIYSLSASSQPPYHECWPILGSQHFTVRANRLLTCLKAPHRSEKPLSLLGDVRYPKSERQKPRWILSLSFVSSFSSSFFFNYILILSWKREFKQRRTFGNLKSATSDGRHREV